jgi:hypothetical protein
VSFKFGELALLVFLQVRQGEILKQQIQILIFRYLKDKTILAFAVGAGLPLTAPATAAAALRTLDAVILYKVVVSRMDAVTQPPRP